MTTVTPDPMPPNPPVGPTRGNSYGIAALVVGIFAVIFCWVPALGALLGLIALTLGIIGYRRNGNGQAIAGFILGGMAALLGAMVTVLAVAGAKHVADHPEDFGNITSQWDGETQRMPLPGQPGDTQLPTIKAIDKFLAGVDGTYLVGRDIPAGTYTSPGPRPGATGVCIWQRLRDATGEADGTIAGDITSGSAAVTVQPTDYALKVTGCAGWDAQ